MATAYLRALGGDPNLINRERAQIRKTGSRARDNF